MYAIGSMYYLQWPAAFLLILAAEFGLLLASEWLSLFPDSGGV